MPTHEIYTTPAQGDQEFRELLWRVYMMIRDKGDSRGPIDCIVPNCMVSLACEAITFFCGTVTVVHGIPGRDDAMRLKSIGFRARQYEKF